MPGGFTTQELQKLIFPQTPLNTSEDDTDILNKTQHNIPCYFGSKNIIHCSICLVHTREAASCLWKFSYTILEELKKSSQTSLDFESGRDFNYLPVTATAKQQPFMVLNVFLYSAVQSSGKLGNSFGVYRVLLVSSVVLHKLCC